ncbi:MAG: ferredoxin family protein [Candidatus Omnitrophota bacterium]
MPHVVTNACTKCTSCVVACPVDAFRGDADMLVIDPEVCIDCGACTAECPVQAIYAAEDIPENGKPFIEINAQKAKECPIINEKK